MERHQPLGTDIIKRLLKKYKCFKGVYPSDLLPWKTKLPLRIIINTDPSGKPGQHWVAISIDEEGNGFFFDSFALPPVVPEIKRFLDTRATKGWIRNNRQIQDITTSTCGYYCVLFIIYVCNALPPKWFTYYWGDNTYHNDVNILKIFKNFSLVKELLPGVVD